MSGVDSKYWNPVRRMDACCLRWRRHLRKRWRATRHLVGVHSATEWALSGTSTGQSSIYVNTYTSGTHLVTSRPNLAPAAERRTDSLFSRLTSNWREHCPRTMSCETLMRVNAASSASYYHSRNISHFRLYVVRDACEISTHDLITSPLDYGHASPCALPITLMRRLYRVQHSTVRLVTR